MLTLNWFEEGKSRRFTSCDKVREELRELLDGMEEFKGSAIEDCSEFWEGYRWQPPETKLKVQRK
jgi:hypothetical protein